MDAALCVALPVGTIVSAGFCAEAGEATANVANKNRARRWTFMSGLREGV
jgi:hypothetical protein